jgi:hypothetical protein
MSWHAARLGLVSASALWLAACADPVRRADAYAKNQGFQAEVVTGTRFRHRVYRAHAESSSGDGVLHVYIEGDGSPFIERSAIAIDPTPRNALMLRLMALDPAPSVYLGRPCYFDLRTDASCNPSYWTLRRFSPEVVDSMTAALLSEAARAKATRLELFGHSGGGTLAVMLAQRVLAVTQIVTIGANLDVNAWTELHGYSSLTGSLSPSDVHWVHTPPPMLHLVGSEDTNTPPALVKNAAPRAGGGVVRVIPGYTHNCCWEQIWPRILSDSGTLQ